jgi:hypothetical protein
MFTCLCLVSVSFRGDRDAFRSVILMAMPCLCLCVLCLCLLACLCFPSVYIGVCTSYLCNQLFTISLFLPSLPHFFFYFYLSYLLICSPPSAEGAAQEEWAEEDKAKPRLVLKGKGTSGGRHCSLHYGCRPCAKHRLRIGLRKSGGIASTRIL